MAHRYPRRDRQEMKAKVLGSLTDDDPGEEILSRRLELVALDRDIRKADLIGMQVRMVLQACKQGWGTNFGEEGCVVRSVKGWLEWFLESHQKVEQWRQQDVTNSPQWQNDEFKRKVWRTAGPGMYAKDALDALQRDVWDGLYGGRWLTPRDTISDWCGDLLEMINKKDADVIKRRAVRDELEDMGYSWLYNEFFHYNHPIWVELHDDLFPEEAQAAADARKATLAALSARFVAEMENEGVASV